MDALFDNLTTRRRGRSRARSVSPARREEKRERSRSPHGETDSTRTVEEDQQERRERQQQQQNMDMPEEPTAEEMKQADIAVDAQSPALHAQVAQDHTLDKIDWKRVNVDDTKRATDYAREHGWDPEQFIQADWCAACVMRNRQLVHNSLFDRLNTHVRQNYRNTKMLLLLQQLQDLYIKGQLDELGNRNPDYRVKWFFLRQLYDHLHEHDLSEPVRYEQTFRKMQQASQEVYADRKQVDRVNNDIFYNSKNVALWIKLTKEADAWEKKARAAFSSNERVFF